MTIGQKMTEIFLRHLSTKTCLASRIHIAIRISRCCWIYSNSVWKKFYVKTIDFLPDAHRYDSEYRFLIILVFHTYWESPTYDQASNAFSKSTNRRYVVDCISFDCFIIIRSSKRVDMISGESTSSKSGLLLNSVQETVWFCLKIIPLYI